MNSAPSVPVYASPWFKSSYSNGAGGECVECARSVDGTLVRDSKKTGGPVVAFRADAWQAFIQTVESGAPTAA
ncbi:DUF397 domain-containing protein [Streptomyces sp. NPDC096311]|uniref:DUF397 domain-containing protein n=1 Tax=Streptomyces sp. NPDC096311 TaxID=3366083 RepID=UPI00381F3779